VNYIAIARNPYMGWRYVPRGGDNDTSVTALCVMALKSARFAGLDVDPDAFQGALAWMDKVTDPRTGLAGYNQFGGSVARPEGLQDKYPPERSRAMTAAAMLTRMFCGQDPGDPILRMGALQLAAMPPRWTPESGRDLYYWYVGSMAAFQVGGDTWRLWNEALGKIEQFQCKGGAADGSWDPIGPWTEVDGGRVCSTALLTLAFELRYRHARAFGTR
jgi:hypothetical protein